MYIFYTILTMAISLAILFKITDAIVDVIFYKGDEENNWKLFFQFLIGNIK